MIREPQPQDVVPGDGVARRRAAEDEFNPPRHVYEPHKVGLPPIGPYVREVWRRHALQFTVVRLVSDRPLRLTPHEVAHALKTTRYVNDELLVQR